MGAWATLAAISHHPYRCMKGAAGSSAGAEKQHGRPKERRTGQDEEGWGSAGGEGGGGSQKAINLGAHFGTHFCKW